MKQVSHACIHCRKACRFPSDLFIVRSSTWQEAGLVWDSGHIHLKCLETKLGRKVSQDEMLVWHVKGDTFGCHADYLKSPEFLEHQQNCQEKLSGV
jgi:hypothetical protein